MCNLACQVGSLVPVPEQVDGIKYKHTAATAAIATVGLRHKTPSTALYSALAAAADACASFP